MIGKDPAEFIGWSMDAWTGKGSIPLSQAHSEGFESWRSQYLNPSVLAASLSDYRAGARIDVEHDQQSKAEGKKIQVNTLQMCSAHLARRFDVAGIWKSWVDEKVELKNVTVGGEGTGHFFPVEESKATSDVLVQWLKEILKS
jgi:haloacetate dehalogenase